MGRGRQKAKQTKVARDLKYYSPPTDYAQLQRELSGTSTNAKTHNRDDDDEETDSDDDYGGWATRH